MTSADITIRPAAPTDAPGGALLIHHTMGAIADYVFGLGDRTRAIDVFARLFAAGRNRLGWRHSRIAEVDGEAAGLLIAYPSSMMKRLEAATGFGLAGIYGIGGFADFVRRGLPLSAVKEARAGEYYVSNIAVFPQYRGRGIGTRLLEAAEESAGAAEMGACSLCVDGGNAGARRLYERFGFRATETFTVPVPRYGDGTIVVHRMVKRI